MSAPGMQKLACCLPCSILHWSHSGLKRRDRMGRVD
uniref:Uncharacterized protein n=1 Tax=Macrostomum lignano TaxID=282301 RepID=A0A1I8F8S7_9PLAT